MTNSAKRRAITFLLLTVLITMLLAAALPHLELQKGIPLPGDKGTAVEQSDEHNIPVSIGLSTFLKAVLGLLLLMMLVYLISRLWRKPALKEVAQAFSAMLFVALVLTAIFFALSNVQVSLKPVEMEVLPTEIRAVGPALEPVPAYLLWLVWAGLAVAVLLLALILIRWRMRPGLAADPLVLEAEQAVQALKAGQDIRSVIIHCYQQMSLILQEEQGISLAETMTAREFETLLHTRGVPDPPVRQLTRLFEIARYGSYPPGPEAEQQAFESLNAIIQFSQKKSPALSYKKTSLQQ